MNPNRRRTLQAACAALLLPVVARAQLGSGETVIRNYDPCISCATHFLRLKVARE